MVPVEFEYARVEAADHGEGGAWFPEAVLVNVPGDEPEEVLRSARYLAHIHEQFGRDLRARGATFLALPFLCHRQADEEELTQIAAELDQATLQADVNAGADVETLAQQAAQGGLYSQASWAALMYRALYEAGVYRRYRVSLQQPGVRELISLTFFASSEAHAMRRAEQEIQGLPFVIFGVSQHGRPV